MMSNLEEMFCKVDWALFAKQKGALVKLLLTDEPPDTALLEGLLSFIDAVQDAAEKDHFPMASSLVLTNHSLTEGLPKCEN